MTPSTPLPACSIRGRTAVLMPGTGSDDDFITRAFAPAFTAAGTILRAVRPEPHDLVDGYRRALDTAAQHGPIITGGVSIGAAVGLWWALENPGATVAVVAALPAWSGAPNDAPASVSARTTAESLRVDGLEAVTATMRAGSPRWLAEELTRSWAIQWPGLPDALEAVADFTSPGPDELRRLPMPLAVVGVTDDPLHPLAVGRDWARWAPRAALRTITLDQLGADPSCLGAAGVAALGDL